jgi:hypothetical protein
MPWSEIDDRKKKERVGASQAAADERHEGFDLSAQDLHHKYERPHFSVVGEGTREANARYRANYEQIDWSK